ncbi:MAG: hypothetical protein RIS67_92 [Pseudomonadota bacterium]|jgi:hypothetical protein
MRMMFSSARLENVENVRKLFEDADIATKIVGGRSYKTYSRRGFSYNERQSASNEPQPQLWVLRADDYRRAREILLENGLLDASPESYIPESYRQKKKSIPAPADRLNRARMALLVAVIALMVIQGIRLINQT